MSTNFLFLLELSATYLTTDLTFKELVVDKIRQSGKWQRAIIRASSINSPLVKELSKSTPEPLQEEYRKNPNNYEGEYRRRDDFPDVFPH